MANHPSTTVSERESSSSSAPLNWFETRAASMFGWAGTLMLASALVPIGLGMVTDWAWVSGLVLIGLAVLALAAGLLGLYPRVHDRARWLVLTGSVGAVIAGAAGFGLIVMSATTLVAEGAMGMDLVAPKGLFKLIAFSMAGGISVGFLSVGGAIWLAAVPSRTVGKLLVAGGIVLFVPVIGELVRFAFGIGPPPWVLFPALALVSIDTLAVGYRL